MKLREPFTAALFGGLVLVMFTDHAYKTHKLAKIKEVQTQPVVSKSEIQASDIFTESGHAPKKNEALEDPKDTSGDVFFIPVDAKNLPLILGRMKPGDKVVFTEGTKVDNTIVQDKVKVEKAAAEQAKKQVNELQKAIKASVEKIIEDNKKNK